MGDWQEIKYAPPIFNNASHNENESKKSENKICFCDIPNDTARRRIDMRMGIQIFENKHHFNFNQCMTMNCCILCILLQAI